MYGGYHSMKELGIKHVCGQIGEGLAVTIEANGIRIMYPVLTKRIGECKHFYIFHDGKMVWLGKKDA